MAGTLTQELEPIFKDGKDKYKLTLTWVADASGDVTGFSTDDGTFLTQTITEVLRGKELVFGEVIPGATTPTASYDAYVYDSNSVDLFSAGFVDMTETVTTTAFPYNGTVYGSRIIQSALTPVVDNAGNAGNGTMVLYFD